MFVRAELPRMNLPPVLPGEGCSSGGSGSGSGSGSSGGPESSTTPLAATPPDTMLSSATLTPPPSSSPFRAPSAEPPDPASAQLLPPSSASASIHGSPWPSPATSALSARAGSHSASRSDSMQASPFASAVRTSAESFDTGGPIHSQPPQQMAQRAPQPQYPFHRPYSPSAAAAPVAVRMAYSPLPLPSTVMLDEWPAAEAPTIVAASPSQLPSHKRHAPAGEMHLGGAEIDGLPPEQSPAGKKGRAETGWWASAPTTATDAPAAAASAEQIVLPASALSVGNLPPAVPSPGLGEEMAQYSSLANSPQSSPSFSGRLSGGAQSASSAASSAPAGGSGRVGTRRMSLSTNTAADSSGLSPLGGYIGSKASPSPASALRKFLVVHPSPVPSPALVPPAGMTISETGEVISTSSRVKAACLPCQTSKTKCDDERPCGRCVRMDHTHLCRDRAGSAAAAAAAAGHNKRASHGSAKTFTQQQRDHTSGTPMSLAGDESTDVSPAPPSSHPFEPNQAVHAMHQKLQHLPHSPATSPSHRTQQQQRSPHKPPPPASQHQYRHHRFASSPANMSSQPDQLMPQAGSSFPPPPTYGERMPPPSMPRGTVAAVSSWPPFDPGAVLGAGIDGLDVVHMQRLVAVLLELQTRRQNLTTLMPANADGTPAAVAAAKFLDAAAAEKPPAGWEWLGFLLTRTLRHMEKWNDIIKTQPPARLERLVQRSTLFAQLVTKLMPLAAPQPTDAPPPSFDSVPLSVNSKPPTPDLYSLARVGTVHLSFHCSAGRWSTGALRSNAVLASLLGFASAAELDARLHSASGLAALVPLRCVSPLVQVFLDAVLSGQEQFTLALSLRSKDGRIVPLLLSGNLALNAASGELTAVHMLLCPVPDGLPPLPQQPQSFPPPFASSLASQSYSNAPPPPVHIHQIQQHVLATTSTSGTVLHSSTSTAWVPSPQFHQQQPQQQRAPPQQQQQQQHFFPPPPPVEQRAPPPTQQQYQQPVLPPSQPSDVSYFPPPSGSHYSPAPLQLHPQHAQLTQPLHSSSSPSFDHMG